MSDDDPITDQTIGRLVDGELARGERPALVRRLHGDPEARARHEADVRIKRALRESLAAFDPSPSAFAREAFALAARRRGRWLAWRPAVAEAAMLAIGWSSHTAYEAWLEPQVPALVEEAAQAHQVFAHDSVRPVESSNATVLNAWFTEHLGEPVVIPDLRPAGLRFIGGRLLAAEQGALALVIYEDSLGRRLSLYIAEDAESDIDDMEIVRLDEVDAGYWRDGDVAYAVVAESSVAQVLQVASVIGLSSSNGPPIR